MTVSEYLERAKIVQNNIEVETSKIIYANEVEIINLNTENQLFEKGVNIFGTPLGSYSSNKTPKQGSLLRGYPKNRGDRYNFLDTGTLFSDMQLRVEGGKLIIFNTDTQNKITNLLSLTGAEFIGLTTENQQILNYEIIYPELMDFIKKTL